MRRLWSSLRLDFRQQQRNGFYYAALFVMGFWLLGINLTALKTIDPVSFVPLLVVFNALLTAFYFVAAQMLLEKGEGTLAGLSVTPLRRWEYLVSKIMSLAAITVAEELVVVLYSFGWPHNLVLTILGMLGMSALYTLIGCWLTSRYESLNHFLMPSVLAILFLLLPFGSVLGLPWIWLAWHPLMPALQLVQAGTTVLPMGQVLYGLIGTLGWIWFCLDRAQNALGRFARPSIPRSAR